MNDINTPTFQESFSHQDTDSIPNIQNELYNEIQQILHQNEDLFSKPERFPSYSDWMRETEMFYQANGLLEISRYIDSPKVITDLIRMRETLLESVCKLRKRSNELYQ